MEAELEVKSKEDVQEKQVFEIDEEVVEENPEVDISVLSKPEQELAIKHGFVKEEKKEDGEHKEQQLDATKVSDEKEEVKEEVKLPTLEEVESDEKHLEKYNANEKALYWKWKNDKRKRQEAQKKADELQAQLELETIKDKSSSAKIRRLKDFLSNPSDDLTVEKLLGIIDDASVESQEDDNKPLTKADLNRIEQEKRLKLEEQSKQTSEQKQRLNIAEQIGKTKYKNFDSIVELAKKVVSEDKTGTYQEILNVALTDPNFDEEKLIDRVVTIAKLSPDFGKESASAEKQEKVEKIIDNSKKKLSSASIGSSGGRRTLSEDELTVDDAAKLSAGQWSRLSPQTKRRLLGG